MLVCFIVDSLILSCHLQKLPKQKFHSFCIAVQAKHIRNNGNILQDKEKAERIGDEQ